MWTLELPARALGLLPGCPPHVFQQALSLQRSVEELGSWLEPVEAELRGPVVGQDLPAVDELLGAQGELEAAVDRRARRAQALLGQIQAFMREGRCFGPDLEEQAQQLLQRYLPFPAFPGDEAQCPFLSLRSLTPLQV